MDVLDARIDDQEEDEDEFHDCVDDIVDPDGEENLKFSKTEDCNLLKSLNSTFPEGNNSIEELKDEPKRNDESATNTRKTNEKDEKSSPVSTSDSCLTSDETAKQDSSDKGSEDHLNSDKQNSNFTDKKLTSEDSQSKEESATETDKVIKNAEFQGTDESEDHFGEGEEAAAAERESSDEESEDESRLSELEIEERTSEAKKLKDEGNTKYKNENFEEARRFYSEGIKLCPKCSKKDRAVLFSNRSACLVKLDKIDDAIQDCTEAISLHPQYLKALIRRAQLYEKQEKYEEAMKDYEKVLELDKSVHSAREALMRLPAEIEKRNEKLKEQMMSSLKDLGNLFLRPFGLSTDNFQMQQDPNSGSYNVQFNNNPGRPSRPSNGPTNGI